MNRPKYQELPLRERLYCCYHMLNEIEARRTHPEYAHLRDTRIYLSLDLNDEAVVKEALERIQRSNSLIIKKEPGPMTDNIQGSRLKIYGASMTQHRGVWTQLARTSQWDSFEFVSRWPVDFATKRLDTNPDHCRLGWIENFEDLEGCDVVLVYFQPGDVLRGALVEAGAGIAMGKRVILVGYPGGTWQHHPAVTQVRSLDQANHLLSAWARDGIPPLAPPSDEELADQAERALDPEPSDSA